VVNQITFYWENGKHRFTYDTRKDGTLNGTVQDEFANGRELRKYAHIDMHPEAINALTIFPQTTGSDAYRGTLSPLLWLLIPGGEPLHQYLKDGRGVVLAGDAKEPIVEFPWRGQAIRLTLRASNNTPI
jgi:hypothetical protein